MMTELETLKFARKVIRQIPSKELYPYSYVDPDIVLGDVWYCAIGSIEAALGYWRYHKQTCTAFKTKKARQDRPYDVKVMERVEDVLFEICSEIVTEWDPYAIGSESAIARHNPKVRHECWKRLLRWLDNEIKEI